MEKTKHKILKYLFTKLDNIKLELYNIYKYRNRNRILYDFEKDSRIVSHENIFIIRDEIKKNKKVNVIKEVKDYLSEIKWLPLYKILKESRKVIFFDEYLYLLREGFINKNNFLKESKNNNFLCKINEKEILKENEIYLYHKKRNIINEIKEEVKEEIKDEVKDKKIINYETKEDKKIIKDEVKEEVKDEIKEDQVKENEVKVKEDKIIKFNYETKEDKIIKFNDERLCNKRKKISNQVPSHHKHDLKGIYSELSKELVQYFVLKNRFLPSFINVNLKNTTNGYLFLSKNTSLNIDLPVKKKDTNIISTFKDKISLYKYCKSRTSLYYKFIKVIQTSGLHQSFKKINEKFIYSSVREMSKNRVTLDYEESSVDLTGFNIESNSSLPYQQEISPTEGIYIDDIEEDTCEMFYPFL